MRNQKGNLQLIVLIIILLAVGAGVYLVQQRTNILPKAYDNNVQTINNVSDLNKTFNELEGTNINQLDQMLEKNNSDTATF